jgi:hypothetical protein
VAPYPIENPLLNIWNFPNKIEDFWFLITEDRVNVLCHMPFKSYKVQNKEKGVRIIREHVLYKRGGMMYYTD